MLIASAVQAQTWHVTPSVSLLSTFTDNVSLSPSDERRSDWVNQFTPGIRFDETGAHTKLAGTISLPMLVYARTSQNNYVAPAASVKGTLEAIDRFLFVDASANVSQQYLSPFGAQPNNLANATQNRYTAQTYSISPYIKGFARDDINYELRQRSTWSDATGVSSGTIATRSDTNDITVHVAQKPRPGGWDFDYAHSDIRFRGQDVPGTEDRETTQSARFALGYRPDPTIQLSAIGGYESNDFFSTHEKGAIYGANVEWHPDGRTSLTARGEHRFFGVGYNVSFAHHTPLTVWSLKASRDISSYPQQLADLPAGANVNQLLDSLFASRVQDPAQRQALVDQVIRERGLPSTLSSAVALFAQQITLVESQNATFGILGVRNSIFLTAYRARNQPIAGSATDTLTPLLRQLIDNTQVGANALWTHRLAPDLTLGLDGNWSRVTDNSIGGTTRLYTLTVNLSRSLSALTSINTGMRYQDSHSDITAGYREFAVFLGLTHTFR